MASNMEGLVPNARAEVGPNGNWAHTNVYAGGKLIGTYDDHGLHLHIDDPLGTRRAQTNASGSLEAVYQSPPPARATH